MRKYSSAVDALSVIKSGQRIFVHGAASTPNVLLDGLVSRAAELTDVEVMHLHTFGEASYALAKYAEAFKVANLFVGGNIRSQYDGDRVDYLPCFLSEIPALFRSGVRPIDVALMHLSPPDEHGFCTLGCSVDVAIEALTVAKVVIAQVNPRMPRVHGDGFIHISKIDHYIEVDEPIPEVERPVLGTIEQAIGENAAVYLAVDPFSSQEVAIKIAHRDIFSDPVNGARFKKMFINEASLAGKLRHPNIVTVFDAGSEHEMHYIVMEYVPGETLKNYCKHDQLLPVDDVIEIAFKCCNALEYAYTHGLIHRDIKPANLLLTTGTDVKITDFGTALLTNTDLTQVVDAVGTPSYMSPEQITGQELTEQADIYSLGVVIYQLLSGRLPFVAENQYDLIQKITNRSPRPLDCVRKGLSPKILSIVDRCLQKDTVDRYQSWRELAQDLSIAHEQLEHTASVTVSDTHKFNTLKQLYFFSDFTDVELWEMLRISKWHRYHGDRTLLTEGRIGSSIYILAGGSATITKNEAFLGVVNAGQCFGEMAYIHGKKKPRTATITSNSVVTVIKIKCKELQSASDHLQTKFNQVLLRTLADRLEKTSAIASKNGGTAQLIESTGLTGKPAVSNPSVSV